MRLGMALEGGGVRCAAQAGVLMTLAEAGIVPAAYAGCGAGALVAALCATDRLSQEKTRRFVETARKREAPRDAMLSGRLKDLFDGMTLRDARPLALPTVDLETGAVQVLASTLPLCPDPRPWSRQALVWGAVRASMATPGVLAPVTWRGHRLAGGGGLRGTLPSLLKALGAERVVCVRVLDAGCAQYERLPAALALCAHAMVAAPPPACDLVIEVGGYAEKNGVLDRRAGALFFEAGRVAGAKALPALQALTGEKNGKILLFPRI